MHRRTTCWKHGRKEGRKEEQHSGPAHAAEGGKDVPEIYKCSLPQHLRGGYLKEFSRGGGGAHVVSINHIITGGTHVAAGINDIITGGEYVTAGIDHECNE